LVNFDRIHSQGAQDQGASYRDTAQAVSARRFDRAYQDALV
jgi:hypothetical protein